MCGINYSNKKPNTPQIYYYTALNIALDTAYENSIRYKV